MKKKIIVLGAGLVGRPMALDLAKEKGVRVICDIGVAPGMSNLLTGHAASMLDTIETIKIFVGGLPKQRTLPWEYKAVFSPTDVIEGESGGTEKRFTYELYDESDPVSGIHSMARTTGYTATVALRMLDAGLFTNTGICFPETLGNNKKIVDFMLKGLKERNITYLEKIEIL